jgi:type IV secretory pathway VirB2 component (pilin)
MVASTGIYEPLRPPLHHVSDTVQGPYAFLAAEILVVLSGLVVVAKLHMAVSTYRKLRTNDFAVIAALVPGLHSKLVRRPDC